MNLRVNLMRQDELRHPSGLERADVLRMAGVVAGVLVVVALGWWGARRVALQSQLSQAKEDWERLRNRNTRLTQLKGRVERDEAIVGQLEAWNASRVEWHVALAGLPAVVPPSIQFTRLTMLGELRVPRPPAAASGERAPARVAPPQRTYKLILDGRAVGERGDEEVVSLVDRLGRVDRLEPLMATPPNLRRMQTDANTRLSVPEREFNVEINLKSRNVVPPAPPAAPAAASAEAEAGPS